jgi:hypothetical protein
MYNTLLDVIYSRQLYATLSATATPRAGAQVSPSFKFLQTLVKTGAWGVRTLRHGAVQKAASVSPRALRAGNLYVYLWGLSQDDFTVRPGSKFIIDLYKFYLQSARYACMYF